VIQERSFLSALLPSERLLVLDHGTLLNNASETHIEPNRWQKCQSDWKRFVEEAISFDTFL
jgi:hypothetical protein